MHRTIDYLAGTGEEALQEAASLIRAARDVFVTGIGASWHAALSAGAVFHSGGRPVYMQEAGELLHSTAIPRGSVIVAISRTGRSIEIVQLVAKARADGATIIGIVCAWSRGASHTKTMPRAVATSHPMSAVSVAPSGMSTDWPPSACPNKIANSDA